MKKICFLSLLSLLFVTMPSCSDELDGGKENPGAAGGRTLFTATVEALQSEADTETQNDFWATGDKLKVVLNDNSAISANLIAGQGTTDGSFMATLSAGMTAKYAVYPESAFDSADGEGLKLNVPAAQSGYLADCKAAAGVVGVGNKAALKNLTAVLPVNILAGAEVCKVELTSVDGSALAGVVPVTFSEEGLVMGEVQSPSSTVSVEVYGAGTYNFAVLPGTHAQGLKVSWYLTENPSAPAGEKVLDATTFAANTLYEAVEIKTVDKSFYVTVEGAGTKDGKSWENAMSGTAFYEMLTSAVYVAPEEPVEPEPTDPAEPALADESADSTEPAAPSVDAFNGATFHFAAGTYNFGPVTELVYQEAVTLEFLGGYDASGNRNAETNVTTFTGNKEHQIFKFGSEMQCKFDGINFVDGYAAYRGGAIAIKTGAFSFENCNFSDNESAADGGAMYFSASGELKFKDCDFTGNKTATTKDAGGLGGAIYCSASSSGLSVTIEGGTISGNTAYRGGFMCSYGASSVISNVTFTANEVTNSGGAIYVSTAADLTFENCVFTENKAEHGGAFDASSDVEVNGCTFENNTTTGNAGAIKMGSKGGLKVNPLNDKPTVFKNNTAANYSGAIAFETNTGSNRINGAHFIGNSAQWGGALEVYAAEGKETRVIFDGCVFEGNYAVDNGGDAAGRGGAIFHECEANIVLLNSTLTGNYSENNGGAIAVMGWDNLQIFQTEFVGNHAKSGGAIYTEGASDKFANLYIDECSFDGHYITATYGTTMNINGIGVFCMNNTSIRNSYNISKQKADKASWVAMDVVQEYTSISNCSIIGNTQYGSDASSLTTMSDAGLIALWGNNHYFTNNIIVPESDAVVSILGGGSDKIDLSYNHYNTVSGVEATDNGGNTTENTAADFGSLEWTDGCWMWNGQIGGAAPEMMTQEAVLARFNSVCPAFVEWCGEDFYKDQLGVVRTGAWWPGAYQKN